MDLTDIYRTFHPPKKDITSSQHLMESSLKIDHILGNKTNTHRYKKIEVIHCVLSDHHGVKLEFNNNTTPRKPTNYGNWTVNYWTTPESMKK